MPTEGFVATTVERARGPVIRLEGTVDRNAKETIETAFRQAANSPGEVILDFSGVDYINSTGIAVIVGILAMARADQRSIGAIGLTDHYREVFLITRLADFIHMYEEAPAGT